jgi:hypothetical protein
MSWGKGGSSLISIQYRADEVSMVIAWFEIHTINRKAIEK